LDDRSAELIKIALSERKVRFTMDDSPLASKLIDGTYRDYERAIPTGSNKVLEISVKELSKAVDRVSVVAERTRAIKLIANKNHVMITASSPDLGSALEEVEAVYDAESLEVGYNFRYLLDILAEIKGETVQISFSDSSSPSVIHDTSDSSAIYVLMPMRV
jgi:DNA polymerase-3 subunit beta